MMGLAALVSDISLFPEYTDFWKVAFLFRAFQTPHPKFCLLVLQPKFKNDLPCLITMFVFILNVVRMWEVKGGELNFVFLGQSIIFIFYNHCIENNWKGEMKLMGCRKHEYITVPRYRTTKTVVSFKLTVWRKCQPYDWVFFKYTLIVDQSYFGIIELLANYLCN